MRTRKETGVAAAPKRGRGRPKHAPTDETRDLVEMLASVGTDVVVIARALKVSPPTLRKHYGECLKEGSARKRAEVIGLLFTSARSGNVSAQKKLAEMTASVVAQESFSESAARSEPRPAPLGKKAQAQEAAKTATRGTDWEEFGLPGAERVQ